MQGKLISMIDLAKAFPILDHAVQCHAEFMGAAIERERQILNVRLLTGWDEKRVKDTASKLRLSIVELRNLIQCGKLGVIPDEEL